MSNLEEINKILLEKINDLMEKNEQLQKTVEKLVSFLQKDQRNDKDDKDSEVKITEEFLIEYLRKNIFSDGQSHLGKYYYCRCSRKLFMAFFEFFVRMGYNNGRTIRGSLRAGFEDYADGHMIFGDKHDSPLKKLKIIL